MEDSIIELIGDFLGKPLVKDPPKREGEYGFQKTHAKWYQLTTGGHLTLNATDHKQANDLSGSSFKKPLFLFRDSKWAYHSFLGVGIQCNSGKNE